MRDGFIKAAAAVVPVVVADVPANTAAVCSAIGDADAQGVNLLVFPELCLTGYTCGDLFFSAALQRAVLDGIASVCEATRDKYPLCIVGAPLMYCGKLYNCALAICRGQILCAVPKTYLPNYNEFYEMRQFTSGAGLTGETLTVCGQVVPFGTDLLLQHETIADYCVGIEICEDLWAADPPSTALARAGALVIANLSASNELIGKADYRRLLVSATSARLLCGYVYANAGTGESTQDAVYSGHCLICENGSMLSERAPFGGCGLTVTELDLARMAEERHRNTSFRPLPRREWRVIPFVQAERNVELTRYIEKNPFVPSDRARLYERAEAVLQIQANGLRRRMEHIHGRRAVIGISGGLDSCLALLVMVRAWDLMGIDRKEILAVTMPCFGTTARTRSNAEILCEELGVSFRTVDIGEAVQLHFRDIGHDPANRNVAYENGQARERTQVIMDIANDIGGIVVGTGDLSELALGWATYNGDHMSMYGVNASIPKTLVRYIVRYEADRTGGRLGETLLDILDTPVSPELLPAEADGSIAQKTENLVGPYELHDFFLYYMLRFGFTPRKIYRLARYAFAGEYPDDVILKWLRTFIRRFFAQQFKRSCLPDGPKVGSASLSPRADWRMPSDASANVWMQEADALQAEVSN